MEKYWGGGGGGGRGRNEQMSALSSLLLRLLRVTDVTLLRKASVYVAGIDLSSK